MIEVLTGTSLAAAAGLNAYLPLLGIGLLARFTDLVTLPDAWAWLTDERLLVVVAVLLVVEMVADKVPAVDSINDVLQTAVRPASGGMVFAAGTTSQTLQVDDPSAFFADNAWVPVAVGVGVALVVHLLKAAVRPVANTMTAGLAAPVLSAAEDAGAVALTIAAVVVPVLAAIGAVTVVALLVRRLRRRRDDRARRRVAAAEA
ncbi:uncharacterized protein DUF4126 [Flavimobilis soli]|uniref:Uncharacterized protein DUF4126 n=1 Tax=Flavimobilis soli TaxID=442709 RepID=A0A2A9E9U4_9MICO|nr:DUF4126 domain-containing protein [Flavimobilis soli]PFG35604.1 uncharacterized protein DUF4126 [Flavimobilis soli]